MSNPTGPILLVEIKFRHLLSTGKSVAIEDAAKSVVLPEGVDKRAFGGIPRAMAKAGEIVEAGYRRGTSSRCNMAMKRLWVATDKLQAKPRGRRHRG